MNWDDVRYFLMLAQQGSLSATARALGVEHSTVARRVSGLEQSLALKLFDRFARGWVLTEEGKRLYPKACEIEEKMLGLQRSATEQSVLSGRVCVSAPPLLLNYFVMPRLKNFRTEYPMIELQLMGERYGADIGRGEAEIALRLFEPREPGLAVRRLGVVNYGLYGTAACCALPESEQTFIGFDSSMPDLPQKRWLDEHVGDRGYVLYANDMVLMREAAVQGWGMAILPCFFAAETPGLQLLAVKSALPSVPVYLVMHPDVRRNRRVRVVADCLIRLFETDAMLL